MVRSVSAVDMPSNEMPGADANPWATSWALMYCRLDADTNDADDVSDDGEPKSENPGLGVFQWTSFFAGVAMVGCSDPQSPSRTR